MIAHSELKEFLHGIQHFDPRVENAVWLKGCNVKSADAFVSNLLEPRCSERFSKWLRGHGILDALHPILLLILSARTLQKLGFERADSKLISRVANDFAAKHQIAFGYPVRTPQQFMTLLSLCGINEHESLVEFFHSEGIRDLSSTPLTKEKVCAQKSLSAILKLLLCAVIIAKNLRVRQVRPDDKSISGPSDPTTPVD